MVRSIRCFAIISISVIASVQASHSQERLRQMDLGQFRCTRDEFCKALGAEGVPTATHYPRTLPKQPAFADFDNEDTPVAESLAQAVFCLPMHHDLSDDHVRIVGEALNKVAEAYRA